MEQEIWHEEQLACVFGGGTAPAIATSEASSRRAMVVVSRRRDFCEGVFFMPGGRDALAM